MRTVGLFLILKNTGNYIICIFSIRERVFPDFSLGVNKTVCPDIKKSWNYYRTTDYRTINHKARGELVESVLGGGPASQPSYLILLHVTWLVLLTAN